MIPRIRHKVSLKLHLDSTPMVELAFPTVAPALIVPASVSPIHADMGRYRVRLAETPQDRDAACRLRFRVFNIELGEGLESSYQTGLDADRFDPICDHLLVEDKLSRRVVGTYRMQSGASAAAHLGYYSEQEFCFAAYEPLRPGILELGRASIDREHRTPEVLMLLWRGIAQYAHDMGLRYLLGCSSLNSNNPAEGWQMYRQIDRFRVPPEFETQPTASYACPLHTSPDAHSGAQREPYQEEMQDAHTQPAPCQPDRPLPSCLSPGSAPVKVPKLLRTYLSIGARIAAPPAWDREFHTIDFLTLLDLQLLSAAARNRFLAPLSQ